MKKISSILFFCIWAIIANAQPASLPVCKHPFVVIAHRGDHVEVPENTIASFENAIRHEVDYVEIDLRTTKDSVLVIMHDATVDRMTNGKGKVSDLDFAEIRKLDVINKSKDPSKKYPIPTFEEVLKTCRNKIHIYLDFKNASVLQSYKMIKQYGMEKQVIVYINSASQYEDWRRLFPSMPVMLSMPDSIKNANQLNAFLTNYPLELLDGDYSDYNPDILKAAKAAGKTVWPDIQNPNENLNWDKALELGFTGLQTDHPQALIEYLKKKGLR